MDIYLSSLHLRRATNEPSSTSVAMLMVPVNPFQVEPSAYKDQCIQAQGDGDAICLLLGNSFCGSVYTFKCVLVNMILTLSENNVVFIFIKQAHGFKYITSF